MIIKVYGLIDGKNIWDIISQKREITSKIWVVLKKFTFSVALKKNTCTLQIRAYRNVNFMFKIVYKKTYE